METFEIRRRTVLSSTKIANDAPYAEVEDLDEEFFNATVPDDKVESFTDLLDELGFTYQLI